jgi:hypothetical protein
LKKSKITYNPKGLKRNENAVQKPKIPKRDLNPKNIVIHSEGNHYWKVEKKK